MKARKDLIIIIILTAVVSSVVSWVLISGIPFAYAHGGDETLIHSCVKDSNGSIQIVSPDDECGNNEYPLDWNSAGSNSTPNLTFYVQTAIEEPGVNPNTSVPAGVATAACEPGDIATGGGFSREAPLGGNSPEYSYPVGNPPTAWSAFTYKYNSVRPFTVYVVCADLTP
ncbi:MAG: hypothetical protein H6657_23430 [Ardenticatenaceae bacterium]|nr:hypothetical protein [Ardenticatenaceae bacterium]